MTVDRPSTFAWRACQLLALLVSVWLLLPAATPVHTEGFTAQIQSLAMLLAEQGTVASHDLSRPRVTDFIFLTRAGVVDLLAAIDLLFGYTGDAGLAGITIFSFFTMLCASAVAAKRLVNIHFSVALVAIISVPGLTELGFYFNDNVVSAAFFSLALLLATSVAGFGMAAWAGAAYAAALLCRVDAVLGAPLLLIFFCSKGQSFAKFALRVGVAGLSSLAVLCIAAWINHGSLLDGIDIAREFTSRLFEDKGLLPGKDPILHFFAPLGTLLILVGAVNHWRQPPAGMTRSIWIVAFYIYPVVLLLYVLFRSFELRYYMPLLAVIVAVHAGRGLADLIEWARGSNVNRRRWALGAVIFGVAVLATPPVKSMMRDGPRLFIGRMWATPAWLEWQDSIRASMIKIADTTSALSQESVAVVATTAWNDEFYIRLRLFEIGYREVPVEKNCRPLSHYRLDDREVWHIRLDPQYALPPFSRLVSTELAIYGASLCPALKTNRPVWVTTFGVLQPEAVANGIEQSDFSDPPATLLLRTPGARSLRPHPHMSYPLFSARLYEAEQWRALEAKAITFFKQQKQWSEDDLAAMLDKYESAFGVSRPAIVPSR